MAEEVHFVTESIELLEYFSDCSFIVFPEICNCPEIRPELSDEPHYFKIHLALRYSQSVNSLVFRQSPPVFFVKINF